MTASLEAPPYFALLSYNMYGKTSERDLAIAEGRPKLKQTLAGAAISLIRGRIHVDPAPPRRGRTL